ncbi:magnesium/cobalt transporter CorA [Aureisphaera sp. CAU 1614]|uniref:Magnesium transport protein CorA n=1 Tax=Halomarinibacterium sedimenti TaxID=2857106 RepID=A0A9X1FPA4_9FLAO|nr:magnesium/cobalt transporter CorA [Halomarinibacterium sedimenti]MBW2938214.1 magnesium/cobalt transporter CorA [Halomarinibacterium sedimenti]
MRKPHKSKKKRIAKTIGKAPGADGYVGQKFRETTDIEIQDYSKEGVHVIKTNNVEDAFKFKTTDQITWINVNGLNHTEEISKLGHYYGLHPLVMEDILNTDHRPKVDEYEDYFFVVLKMLYFNKDEQFTVEHISLVLGKNYVLTFQESEEDIFDSVRSRIANPESRIRMFGADYLAFALIDTIVDNYFAVIEDFGEKIEALEDQVFNENPDDETPKSIQFLKREVLKIRRSVFPLREVISRIEKSENPIIEERNRDYYRDTYDHVIQINENIEIYRDMVWGLMDMYMTTVSNKMNNIMKVLTIIATIFIPLTFIAGIYGMNFEHMPELHYKYSYYILWAVMVLVFLGMLYYFRRKRWL